MPFPLLIPLAGMGISALGNWLGNRNKNKAVQTSQQQSVSTPTMSPEYMGLQNALLPSITKRLTSSSALPRGYEEQGIGGINRTYDLGKQSIENNLTSRGLGSSPIAGAAGTRLETGRLGSISDFQGTLPMVRREMENQDLQLAQGILGLGRGNTVNSTGTSTAGAGGGGAAGLVGGLASSLGWMMGNGLFGGGAKAPLVNKMNPMDMMSGFKG